MLTGLWDRIKSFIFSAAEYNKQNQNQINFFPAEIWVALQVEVNPDDNVLKIKTFANQANNIFPNTCKIKLLVPNKLLNGSSTGKHLLDKIHSYKQSFSNNIEILQQITMQEIYEASYNCGKQLKIHMVEEATLMLQISNYADNDIEIFWKCKPFLSNIWNSSNVIIHTDYQIHNVTTDTKCILTTDSDLNNLAGINKILDDHTYADVIIKYNRFKEPIEMTNYYKCQNNHIYSSAELKRIPYLSITETELLKALRERKQLKNEQHLFCNIPRLFILPEAITFKSGTFFTLKYNITLICIV